MSLVSGFSMYKDYYVKYSLIINVFLLLFFIILSLTGVIDIIFNAIGFGYIHSFNSFFLKAEMSESLKVFIELSELNASLAILESTRAGFSFIVDIQTQFGKIIHSLHVLVATAWKASLLSLCSIELTELILLLSRKISKYILSLLITVQILFLVLKTREGFIYQVTCSTRKFLAILTLLFYIVLPVFVSGMGLVAVNMSAPIREQIHSHISQQNSEIRQNNKSYNQKGSYYSQKLHEVAPHVKNDLETLAGHLPMHIAMVVFTYIIFPLLLPIGLYLFFRFHIGHQLYLTSNNGKI